MFKSLLILLTLVGCGQDLKCINGCPNNEEPDVVAVSGKDGTNGKNGTSCTVYSNEEFVVLTCEDGTKGAIVRPKDGQDGIDGKDGVDGKDGQDGQIGPQGEPGEDGQDGADGKDGANGEDGRSCTVQDFPNKVVMTCPDGSTASWDKPVKGNKHND